MKKSFALLIAGIMILSVAACGGKGGSDKPDNDKTKPDSGNKQTEDTIIDADDLKDFEDALDKLEDMMPEGWDENAYGAYIYDVWDEEFLPDCLPGPVEGIKADQTTFKDYDHDTMSGSYSIGPIFWEAKEDYREYGVSFYANIDQLDAYLLKVTDAGFLGGELTSREDNWWEFEYYMDGWFLYIFVRTDVHQEGYDSLVTISLTDSLFEHPESVNGIPLPQAGFPDYDYTNYCSIFNEYYDELEFDLANDTFPEDEPFAMFFTYRGVTPQDAKDYAEELKSLGWTVESERDTTTEAEPDYYALFIKDGIYAQVDYSPYESYSMQIGFSDMVEFLQY